MKILEVKSLKIADVKVIRFGRFPDQRGFFGESFRKSDFQNSPQTPFLKGIEFQQCNEAFSRAGTIRGLHFQWNPYMGKLVRTLSGRMIDIVMDIRKNSPTFGKIIAYDLPANLAADFTEWIWVPVGFAHGNFFDRESYVEYFCSGEWSPGCEAGISPFAKDIDWSLCDPNLKEEFDRIAQNALISHKDSDGLSLASWLSNPDSDKFVV
jgi:dTDP-4-dehydrorhamnose 3,5-epimerase